MSNSRADEPVDVAEAAVLMVLIDTHPNLWHDVHSIRTMTPDLSSKLLHRTLQKLAAKKLLEEEVPANTRSRSKYEFRLNPNGRRYAGKKLYHAPEVIRKGARILAPKPAS